MALTAGLRSTSQALHRPRSAPAGRRRERHVQTRTSWPASCIPANASPDGARSGAYALPAHGVVQPLTSCIPFGRVRPPGARSQLELLAALSPFGRRRPLAGRSGQRPTSRPRQVFLVHAFCTPSFSWRQLQPCANAQKSQFRAPNLRLLVLLSWPLHRKPEADLDTDHGEPNIAVPTPLVGLAPWCTAHAGATTMRRSVVRRLPLHSTTASLPRRVLLPRLPDAFCQSNGSGDLRCRSLPAPFGRSRGSGAGSPPGTLYPTLSGRLLRASPASTPCHSA